MGCRQSRKSRKKAPKELPPTAASEIASETKYTLEELTELYDRFRAEHPSGVITKKQLISLYKLQYPEGNPKEFANLMFTAFDTNNDGILDFKEFLVGLGLVNGADIRLKLKWVFELWDEDKNGVITYDELVRFYRVVQSMIPGTKVSPEKRAKKIFQKMDVNGDGRICVGEFVEAVLRNPEYIYPIPLWTFSVDFSVEFKNLQVEISYFTCISERHLS